MTLKELKALQVGDIVRYQHPDTGDPLICFVQEIFTQTGYLSDLDEALLIADESNQAAYEVCAYELS